MNGINSWFPVRRSIIEAGILHDHAACTMLLFFLSEAVTMPTKRLSRGKLIELQPGQVLCSLSQLQTELKMTREQARQAMKRLQATQFVTQDTTQFGTVVTICEEYITNFNKGQQQHRTQHSSQQGRNTVTTQFDRSEYKEYRYNKSTKSLDSERIKKERRKEIQKKTPAGAGAVCVSAEAEKIFRLYPDRDPISKRSTGKTNKDKQLIDRLLRDGYPLESSIRFYICDCRKSRTYIRNFRTFLLEPPAVGQVSDRQAEREIISNVNSLMPKAKKENWNPTPIKTADVPAIGDNAFLQMITSRLPVLNMAQRTVGNE